MKRIRKTYRILLVVLLLSFASLHLLSSAVERKSARGQEFTAIDRAVLAVHHPVQSAAAWPFRKVRGLWRRYAALTGLAEQNRRLEREIENLRGQLVEIEELRHEVRELREMLDYADSRGQPVAVARVTGRSFLPEVHTILIDQGSSQGVARDSVAATPAGLLGHVTGTARSVSRTASPGL